MSYLVRLVLIAITAALVNNFVLVKFLGICPFLAKSDPPHPPERLFFTSDLRLPPPEEHHTTGGWIFFVPLRNAFRN